MFIGMLITGILLSAIGVPAIVVFWIMVVIAVILGVGQGIAKHNQASFYRNANKNKG